MTLPYDHTPRTRASLPRIQLQIITAGVTFAVLHVDPPVGWLDQLACTRLHATGVRPRLRRVSGTWMLINYVLSIAFMVGRNTRKSSRKAFTSLLRIFYVCTLQHDCAGTELPSHGKLKAHLLAGDVGITGCGNYTKFL